MPLPRITLYAHTFQPPSPVSLAGVLPMIWLQGMQ